MKNRRFFRSFGILAVLAPALLFVGCELALDAPLKEFFAQETGALTALPVATSADSVVMGTDGFVCVNSSSGADTITLPVSNPLGYDPVISVTEGQAVYGNGAIIITLPPMTVGADKIIGLTAKTKDGRLLLQHSISVALVDFDVSLSGLNLSPGDLKQPDNVTIGFSSTITAYTVNPAAPSFTITAVPNNPLAAVGMSIDRGTLTGTSVQTVLGSSLVTIRVTAPHGASVQDYTLNLTRLTASNEALITAFNFTSGSVLAVITDSGLQTGSTVSQIVPAGTDLIDVSLTGKLTVSTGADFSPKTASFANADYTSFSPAAITVTAEDGTTTKTYDVTVKRYPGVPTGVSVTGSAGKITVSWVAPAPSTEVGSYELYVIDSNSPPTPSTDATTGQTGITGTTRDITVPNGETRYVWIRARSAADSALAGAWSSMGSGAAMAEFTTAPVISSLTPGNGSLGFNLTASVPSADSYDVYYYAGSTSNVATIKAANNKVTVSGTIGTITGLNNGQTYSLAVTAKKAGHTDKDSTAAETTLPAYYSAPTDITDTNGVTASVTFNKASPQAPATSVIATVNFSGAAAAGGTFTVNLTSAKAGLSGAARTQMIAKGQSPTAENFTFTVPEEDVNDFILVFTWKHKADLKEAFGINTAGTTGVNDTFNDIHDYVAGRTAAQLANDGLIQLGDYIDLPSITLDNTTITDQVITPGNLPFPGYEGRLLRLIVVGINSFNANGDYTGNGNGAAAHLVFQFQNLVFFDSMNSTTTNAGGYKESEMRAYITGVFFTGLKAAGVPDSVIWTPRRYVANGGSGATGADLIQDQLWLPTERELFGIKTHSTVYETAANQARLEYYTISSRRIKHAVYNVSMFAYTYWAASPSGANHFCCVNSLGNTLAMSAGVGNGVAPAFCVK
jgi:hypothetical protein